MSEPYDQDDWWHATVNLLGGLNYKQCDAFLSWDDEMADWPDGDNDEFLRRCVAVADRAKAEGWIMIEEKANFLCPKCAGSRELWRSLDAR